MACAGCDKPILDKFLLHVLERAWHAACVRCADCRAPLTEKCFSREAKLFCREDFFRRYGTKCSGCGNGISPSDLVRKARERVFHLNCFTCLVCRKQLSTGEELYVLDDNKFICKVDYLAGKAPPIQHTDSLLGSGSEDEDDEEAGPKGHTSLSPGELPHATDLALNSDSKTGQDDSEDQPHFGKVESKAPTYRALDLHHHDKSATFDCDHQGSVDGNPETRDSQAENRSPDDGNGGSKRRGPRTTIKAKQLEILKTAFSQTPKPTRHIREQLAKETGLPMRVIQVWFQNKRSKERRLKQLTSMGRGPFFGSSRKMRGFPMNLSPGGLDEGPPGFPYFATADVKFEFGYGGPPFHGHEGPFFPAHHPPGPMSFAQQGGPMEHGGPMPMGFEGGGPLEGGFLAQGGPPPEHLLAGLPRGSPDFLPQQPFNDGSPGLHSEGLVW